MPRAQSGYNKNLPFIAEVGFLVVETKMMCVASFIVVIVVMTEKCWNGLHFRDSWCCVTVMKA